MWFLYTGRHFKTPDIYMIFYGFVVKTIFPTGFITVITVYITTLRFLSLDETGNAIAPQQVYACAIVLVYFSRVPKRLILI